jgi:ABC transporter substrate binding protein (PQQ-dependent alcohol dehydrogenase system)
MIGRFWPGVLGVVLALSGLPVSWAASTHVVGVVELNGDPRYSPRRTERAYPGHPTSRAAEGLRLGLSDSGYELRSQGLSVDVHVVAVREASELPAALKELSARKVGHLVADLPPELLGALVQQAPGAMGSVVIFNTSQDDDGLRGTHCAPFLLHTLPSRAMLNDALAQFLAARKWTQVLSLTGPSPGDALQQQAMERSARRFGVRLVEQKPFKLTGDPRERDLGNVRLLTANRQADVVWVNDADGEFARTVPYNNNLPRPVVGASGLTPLAWHPQHERFGAPQLSRRFIRQTSKPMVGHDWASWIAGRAIAAALLAHPKGPVSEQLRALRSGAITLDGFKGKQLTFRSWDGQLRQPVFLSHGDGVAGMAPMDGVLHPTDVMDTLGFEERESACRRRQ